MGRYVKMGQNQAKGQYASVGMIENNNDEKPESDLTFVFHNDEGIDSHERVVHEINQKQRDPSDEPSWTIYKMEPGGIKNVIGTRRRFQPCQPLSNFVAQLSGPHILEISAEEQHHQWVIFVDLIRSSCGAMVSLIDSRPHK